LIAPPRQHRGDRDEQKAGERIPLAFGSPVIWD
jgi:hypothetical protein